jgi:transcriptional regulator with XRE-family HTH domain
VTADAQRTQLREYRVRLGWTQQEMADRLAHLAWMKHRERVAVNADMIAKWERGAKGVSPRYRELLCELFGVTPDQLGLKNTPAPAAVRAVAPGGDESLIGLLDNAAQLLDQLGAAGTALAPHMLHAWKDTVTTRRTMLGLLDPAATEPLGHARAATATITELEQLAERYHALYDSADPAALMTPVAAHLRMTTEALRRDPAPEQRHRLLRNRARVATLAGRLAYEDLGDALSGRAYYGMATDSAREAEDDQTAALALGYAAQLAHAEGMTSAALNHLAAALAHAERAPTVAPWLASIQATIHADSGDHTAATDALHRAEPKAYEPVQQPSLRPDYGPVHLAAVTGHTRLQAGHHTAARAALTVALDQLPPHGRRARVLALADLATAELHAGNLPDACRHAITAAELLCRTPYATGAARLRAFRAVAARPINPRALRMLDQHLAQLAA